MQGLCEHGLERDLFEKFDRLTMRHLDGGEGLTFCPSECGWCIFNFNGQWLKCDLCTEQTRTPGNDDEEVWYCLSCFTDGVPAEDCKHPRDLACAEHRQRLATRRDDAGDATARYFQLRAKQCPGCNARLEKVYERDGTNCMRMNHTHAAGCVEGGTKFCWCCLADLRHIDAHDNSFHKRWCLKWASVDGDATADRHQRDCPDCAAAGPGTFCNARPVTPCTRAANGAFETYSNTFCACHYGCPCDTPVVVSNTCECGEFEGRQIPSEDCRCGGNVVRVQERDWCRLCGRAAHQGYKCIEDRLPEDPSPPGEDEQCQPVERPGAAGSSAAANDVEEEGDDDERGQFRGGGLFGDDDDEDDEGFDMGGDEQAGGGLPTDLANDLPNDLPNDLASLLRGARARPATDARAAALIEGRRAARRPGAAAERRAAVRAGGPSQPVAFDDAMAAQLFGRIGRARNSAGAGGSADPPDPAPRFAQRRPPPRMSAPPPRPFVFGPPGADGAQPPPQAGAPQFVFGQGGQPPSGQPRRQARPPFVFGQPPPRPPSPPF